jgi:hypothetical protein
MMFLYKIKRIIKAMMTPIIRPQLIPPEESGVTGGRTHVLRQSLHFIVPAESGEHEPVVQVHIETGVTVHGVTLSASVEIRRAHHFTLSLKG